MKRMVAAVLIFMVVGAALAAPQNIIPADRRTDWMPGVTAGVPGGIPSRATIGATVGSHRSRIPASYRFVHGTDPVTSAPAFQSRVPAQAALHQSYPEPFNPTTTIRFQLVAASSVSLRIFDILGREVATLANSRYSPGTHDIRWNAFGIASGVCLCRIEVTSQAGGARPVAAQTRAMLLVKIEIVMNLSEKERSFSLLPLPRVNGSRVFLAPSQESPPWT